MSKFLKTAALAMTIPAVLATALPAAARDRDWDDRGDRWEQRDRHDDRYESRRDYRRDDRRDDRRDSRRGWEDQGRNYGNYGSYGGYQTRVRYAEPVYANTRVWRGDDGRSYCRRSDGTTGLLIGGAAGALIGREVAGRRGDRTLGAILGAAGGALLGRAVDRGGSSCR
ncbi:glycine zipper 2TM domain-containing protein [Novosphingobium sp.]|uniref:glycine zipper 2TM domain-containing protein n=1 Tax=Novosphingobium sp. TaxID=1874826 RepID=UPI0027356CEF|nr:glycine zipper 2TM domain-containing protein [Novosphingobium sp.]MDP3908151.1 glycine zipper 2TM domain-containing protein [Novosphingobium sp.]